ncbi:antifreeze protein [Telmatospirillum sp. J64-1]|uniref:antifreeze protein n=1 Tax=Telmatospirillum sp. J64-1 TaxID=2502183 RepID=UPI00115D1B1B|nr:antifreeze protein [Telmatospirillum sp. J64-1]
MNVSDVSRRAVAALVVAAAMTGPVMAASAAPSDISAPLRLLPLPGGGMPSPAPQGEQSFQDWPSEPAAAPVEREVAPRSDIPWIEVQELKAPSAAAVGILEEAQGGFGLDMWSGTRLALVQRLLPHLPAVSDSPAMRDLSRRLLLSTARVPEGKGNGESLLKLRFERLWAMGDVDGMMRLLQAVPASAVTPEIQRFKFDALLLRGDTKGACRELPVLIKRSPSDYLTKGQAFCQLLDGRMREAGLTLELLREQGHQDPAFFAAAETIMGQRRNDPIKSLNDPDPLQLAALIQAKLPLPTDVVESRRPAVLAAIAANDETAMEIRLRAAERAERFGALSTQILRDLYNNTTFTEQELGAPLSQVDTALGARGHALFFRLAQMEAAPNVRAEIIARALNRAQNDGRFADASRIYAPLILSLRPSSELVWFSGHAARALLAAGEIDGARVWGDVAARASRNNPDAAATVAGLWPLLRIVDTEEGVPRPEDVLDKWRKARPAETPEQEMRRSAVLYSMLDALGEPIRTEDWVPLMERPILTQVNMPQPALWHALRIAAEDLRLGETVLLGLVSLGEGGPTRAEATSLYRVVASLRLVGLDAEARRLALEAAIATGV